MLKFIFLFLGGFSITTAIGNGSFLVGFIGILALYLGAGLTGLELAREQAKKKAAAKNEHTDGGKYGR